MQSVFALLEKSGPIGAVILVCSVTALYITIERWLALREIRFRDPRFLHRVRKRTSAGAFDRAMAMVQTEKHPMAIVLAQALVRLNGRRRHTRTELEHTMSHVAAREVRTLEKHLPTLDLLASVTPLLGLLGTVAGMIKAFQVIQQVGGRVNAAVLAGGIWEAMLTTVLGLCVAIPTMVAHNYLQERIYRIVGELKEEAARFLDILEDGGFLGSDAQRRPSEEAGTEAVESAPEGSV